MRIVSYNLFEGAQNTYPELAQFAAAQEADIICLQEANKWGQGQPAPVNDLKDSLGFSSAILGGSNTRFELATFARQRFKMTEAFSQGFWHAAIHAAVDYQGDLLHVWNVHLNPQGEDKRLAEVRLLAKHLGINALSPQVPEDGLIVVTGDYNSLSRTDGYDDGLADRLKAQGITKFGTEGLLYEVTDYMASIGMVDVAAARGDISPTVPTPANTDAYHADDLRLDYMFVSPALFRRVVDYTVIKNPLTDKISDHYPSVLALD